LGDVYWVVKRMTAERRVKEGRCVAAQREQLYTICKQGRECWIMMYIMVRRRWSCNGKIEDMRAQLLEVAKVVDDAS
jgi:hypothetical protein